MRTSTGFRLPIAILAVLVLCHCSGGNVWDDIDYSKVRGGYENDSSYVLPSVLSCTSDDLFTCN